MKTMLVVCTLPPIFLKAKLLYNKGRSVRPERTAFFVNLELSYCMVIPVVVRYELESIATLDRWIDRKKYFYDTKKCDVRLSV